jgi:hypothetical protein
MLPDAEDAAILASDEKPVVVIDLQVFVDSLAEIEAATSLLAAQNQALLARVSDLEALLGQRVKN